MPLSHKSSECSANKGCLSDSNPNTVNSTVKNCNSSNCKQSNNYDISAIIGLILVLSNYEMTQKCTSENTDSYSFSLLTNIFEILNATTPTIAKGIALLKVTQNFNFSKNNFWPDLLGFFFSFLC